MNGKWLLQLSLDGNYKTSTWLSYEGAIADRDRQLKPRRIKDSESVTGFRMVYPNGWTAIRRVQERS